VTDYGSPENADLIREAIASAMLPVFVACPGIVQSYDDDKKTCSVAPATRRPVPMADGTMTTEEVPVIQNVPVLVLGTPAVSVEVDLVRGDSVFLVFCDYSFAGWRSTGAVADPRDARKHGPSYPVAIPWHRPKGRASTDEKATMGKAGGVRIHFKDETIEIGEGGDFVARASVTNARLDALEAFASSHTHPVSGPAAGPSTPPFVAGGGPVDSTNLKVD
jgi:hypothetical protein